MSVVSDNVSTVIKERINHPFLFSMILSWPIINYKFIVVLISNETYRDKFRYIENVLYDSFSKAFIYVVLLPLSSAIFYTLIFPIIDIALSVLSQKITNWKKTALLREQKKEPFDRDLQIEFFKRYEENIKYYKNTIKSLLDNQPLITKNYAHQISKLNDRLHRQCCLILAIGTGLTPEEINELFNLSVHDITAIPPKLLEGGRKIKIISELNIVINSLSPIQLNPDSMQRVINIGWITYILKVSIEEAYDFMQILIFMNIAQKNNDETDNFLIIDHMQLNNNTASRICHMLSS